MKKKGLALVLALALLVIGVVGGTLAWLTAKSDTVTNTFTISNIEVKLEETKGTTVAGGKEFQMIPGYTIDKDPKAWVVAGSVDCYLFVKLDMANNTYGSGDTAVNFLSYEIADGWTLVTGQTNVYYRVVTTEQMSSDKGVTKSFPVLKDNKVTVSGEVTKEMMTALNAEGAVKPTLTVTAYACQLYKSNTEATPAANQFSPADAWAKVAPATTTNP